MPGSKYDKSTKEHFKEFVYTFVPPPAKGDGLIERKPLDQGGQFLRNEILGWFKEHYPELKRATVNANLIVLQTIST